MKRLQKLKPKVKIQNDFYVLDTETGYRKKDKIHYSFIGQPEGFIFGAIVGNNFTKVFHDLEELKTELLDERYKGKKVFAHNAEYDLNTLYGNIYDMDPEAIFNGKFISASNGNCQFADSMNILGASVKRIGAMMGKEKQELGSHQMVSKMVNGLPPAKDINYCIRDCEIVWDALLMMFEEASDIKITQASLSMTYYRRFHQPFTIEHNDNTRYFWESYFGGRTECFKIGPTHARIIDVNSMYPDRMRNEVFPNPKYLKKSMYVKPVDFLRRYLPYFEGCVKMKIRHKNVWIGYLPVKIEGKLCFPVGEFSGCWNFNEIRYALEAGVIEILNIEYVVYSQAMKSPFVSYIDELYDKRYSVQDLFHIYRIKIYMNSLYGKFAQKIQTEAIYLDNVANHIDLIQEHQREGTFLKLDVFNALRSDAFLIVKTKKNFSLNYSIPSFASYITSGARIKLLDQLVKMESKRPVYCDTDSIAFEVETFFPDTKQLGAWSMEKKIITEVRGLKNYSYISGDEIENKIKGVPRKAKQLSKNTFQYKSVMKTKEALRRQMDPGKEVLRTKILTNKYTKRIVLNDGQTKPIEL